MVFFDPLLTLCISVNLSIKYLKRPLLQLFHARASILCHRLSITASAPITRPCIESWPFLPSNMSLATGSQTFPLQNRVRTLFRRTSEPQRSSCSSSQPKDETLSLEGNPSCRLLQWLNFQNGCTTAVSEKFIF